MGTNHGDGHTWMGRFTCKNTFLVLHKVTWHMRGNHEDGHTYQWAFFSYEWAVTSEYAVSRVWWHYMGSHHTCEYIIPIYMRDIPHDSSTCVTWPYYHLLVLHGFELHTCVNLSCLAFNDLCLHVFHIHMWDGTHVSHMDTSCLTYEWGMSRY